MSYKNKTEIWDCIQSGENELYTVCSEQDYKTLLGAINEMLNIEK